MEQQNDRIGNGQLLCLLALSHSFLLLNERAPLENGLLLLAVFAAVSLVLFLLLYLFRSVVIQHPVQCHPFLRRSLWGICLVYFVVNAHLLLDEVSVIFQGEFSPLAVLLILFVAITGIATMGLEALCRGAFVLMFFFLMALLLLGIGCFGQCSLLNLQLPETSLDAFSGNILTILPAAGAELLLFFLLLPACAHPRAHGAGGWIAAAFGISAVLLLTFSLTMGEYGSLAAYPLYALSRTAQLSSTAVLTPAFWFLLLCAATLRLSALLTAAARLRGVGKNRLPWWEVILILIGTLLLLYSDARILLLQRVAGIALLIVVMIWRLWPWKEKPKCETQRSPG